MPYPNNRALPSAVRNNLPGGARSIFRNAFNFAYHGSCNGDDGCASAAGWAAIKRVGYKKDKQGKWVRRKKALGKGFLETIGQKEQSMDKINLKKLTHSAAWHDCVDKVSANSPDVNAYAVCTYSLSRTGNVYAGKEPDEAKGKEGMTNEIPKDGIEMTLDEMEKDPVMKEHFSMAFMEKLRKEEVMKLRIMPDYSIEKIKKTAATTEEGRELNGDKKEDKRNATLAGGISYDEIRQRIQAVLNEDYPREGNTGTMDAYSSGQYWIQDMFDGVVVVRDYQDGALYSIDYSLDENNDVSLDGDPVEVELQYVPVGGDEGGEEEMLLDDGEGTGKGNESKKSVATYLPSGLCGLWFSKQEFPDEGAVKVWLQEHYFPCPEEIERGENDKEKHWIVLYAEGEDPNNWEEKNLSDGVIMMLRKKDPVEVKAVAIEGAKMIWCHAEVKPEHKAKDKDDIEELIKAKDFFIEGWASTEDLDRTKDVVQADAFKDTIEEYKSNPIVLYMHKADRPIGTAQVEVIPGKGLHAKANISRTEPEIRTKILEGILRAFSFGFKPIEEKSERLGEENIRRIKKLDLFEISVVPIPMNKRALFSFTKALELGSDLVCKKCGETCSCQPEGKEDIAMVYKKRWQKAVEHIKVELSLLNGEQVPEEVKAFITELAKDLEKIIRVEIKKPDDAGEKKGSEKLETLPVATEELSEEEEAFLLLSRTAQLVDNDIAEAQKLARKVSTIHNAVMGGVR